MKLKIYTSDGDILSKYSVNNDNETDSELESLDESQMAKSPILNKYLPNRQSQAKEKYGFKNCLEDKLIGLNKIGQGKSGSVYLTNWSNIKSLFSKQERYSSSYDLDPKLDPITIKTVKPFDEIRQRIGGKEKRTLKNLVPYFQDFGNRCNDVYRFMDQVKYFGIPQHIIKIYGCTYSSNTTTTGDDNLPTMILASEYLPGLDMIKYFANITKNNINLAWVTNLLLQGISIALVLYQYGFYHNDLTASNIFIQNTNNNINLKFPLLKRNLVLNCDHESIPFMGLIDFDLASVGTPRNSAFILETTTKLPLLDITVFIMAVYQRVTRYNGGISNINNNINALFNKIISLLDPLYLNYKLELDTFSRGKLIFDPVIDHETQVETIKSIFSLLVVNSKVKIDLDTASSLF